MLANEVTNTRTEKKFTVYREEIEKNRLVEACGPGGGTAASFVAAQKGMSS